MTQPKATGAKETAVVQKGVTTTQFASRSTLVLRRFLRNEPAVVSLILLVVMFAGCYLLPQFLPFDFKELNYAAAQEPPSPEHLFGTNSLGQDLLALTLRGMQKSMLIGLCVAAISATIAATVGTVAGYFLGWRDRVLMFVVDLLLVVPGLVLVAIITPQTKQSGTIIWLILLLAAFGWMISSRMVRGLTLGLRDREFVRAARYMGVSSPRIIIRHILPNVASILIIDTALNVGLAILGETGLSYLGFGVQPPDVSLGTLISDGTNSATTFPWVFLFPAGVLVLIVFCANLVGDGLRDAFDPSSQQLRRRRKK
jgi:peptide/nickel transport system permease protein